jgi:hypothetical protein
MKYLIIGITIICNLLLMGCQRPTSEQSKEANLVNAQQAQYAKAQPIPMYNWSLERKIAISIYNARNEKVATHAVWRSNSGMVEGSCPSLGFGLPYDVSLTNPIAPARTWWGASLGSSIDVVEQPEPNGIFASKNTNATWVMCTNEHGGLDPIYTESKVTVYPYSVEVNYSTNRVVKIGESNITVDINVE